MNMDIDRRVTFTLTVDTDGLRLLRDALITHRAKLRTSVGVKDLSDEQISTVRGDGPGAQCRKAGEWADHLESLITCEVRS